MTTDRWLLLATGPSAPSVDLSAYAPERIVVISDAWQLAPFARALYAADKPWWLYHRAAVEAGFTGQRYASEHALGVPGVTTLRLHMQSRSLRSDVIYRGAGAGASSPLQALQLMWQWGANAIDLGGIDLQPVDGRAHFFGDHPAEIDTKRRDFAAQYVELQHLFDQLRGRGVCLRNRSPYSTFAGVPPA